MPLKIPSNLQELREMKDLSGICYGNWEAENTACEVCVSGKECRNSASRPGGPLDAFHGCLDPDFSVISNSASGNYQKVVLQKGGVELSVVSDSGSDVEVLFKNDDKPLFFPAFKTDDDARRAAAVVTEEAAKRNERR